jgi:predicted SnoaL-like aldol condensation-catalyzing enzyme
MVDGPTEVTDLEKTETNRNLVRSFVSEILIEGKQEKLGDHIDETNFIDHNPRLEGLSELRERLGKSIRYERLHRVLTEGNFVLTVCEGALEDKHTSFYDLFRVAEGRLVEHWDTTETIPPRSQWKNNNGKF